MLSQQLGRRPSPAIPFVALLLASALPNAASAQDCSDSGLNPTAPPAPTFPVLTDGDSLQDAIDSGIGSPTPWVVEVGPGTYEPVLIFADSFPGGLILYSTDGPATTTIARTVGDGPVVTIIGDDEPIEIGRAQSTDPDEWQGFRITGGYVISTPDGNGGGIRVTSQSGPLGIRGNVIDFNNAVHSGGGVFLGNCADAVVAANEIANNAAGFAPFYFPVPLRGAGVYQELGNLQLSSNEIHDNFFGSELAGYDPEPPRQGGGVASLLTSGGDSLLACTNVVRGNNAEEGNGVWVELFGHNATSFAHIQQNRIHDNVSWIPDTLGLSIERAFRGGGIFVLSPDLPVELPAPVIVNIFTNRIRNNVVTNPGLTVELPPTDETGGGTYCEFFFRTLVDAMDIVGNGIWSNITIEDGGGSYLDYSGRGPGLLHHNTWMDNQLDSGGLGCGIYITNSTNFDGSSNVIFENTDNDPLTGGNREDWFAEPLVTDEFRYTQLPVFTGFGADLFGAAINMNSALDPVFFDPVPFVPDPHLTAASAACLELGEPGLVLPAAADAVDIDGHARLIDWPGAPGAERDRGADEFVAFKRGNVNADFTLDLADATFLLAYLFQGGATPVCPDSADVNDDGMINLADPVYLLAYLFQGGPPPPEPFFTCGDDPTPDLLDIGQGTPCF